MTNTIHCFVRKINPARPVCDALLGKKHTHIHRMMVGTVVMGTGVLIAKYTGHSEYEVIAYLGDAVGYGIHGLGLTPFLEFLMEKFGEAAL